MSDRPLSSISARDAWLAAALKFFAEHAARVVEVPPVVSLKPWPLDEDRVRALLDSPPQDVTLWPEVDWATGEMYWPHEPNSDALAYDGCAHEPGGASRGCRHWWGQRERKTDPWS